MKKVNKWLPNWLILVAIMPSFTPAALAQRQVNLELLAPDALQPLESKNGYALIELDVSGVAPSIQITRTDNKSSRKHKNKRFLIDLSKRNKGLFAMQLAPGKYQITQINAPYYNLPFQMSTDGDTRWQFVVESGKTSYIGLLKIAEERTRNSVNIDLYSRIATSLDDIEEQFGSTLDAAPLMMGRAIRDDFLQDQRDSGATP